METKIYVTNYIQKITNPKLQINDYDDKRTIIDKLEKFREELSNFTANTDISKKPINKLDFSSQNIRNLLNKYEIKDETVKLDIDNNDLTNLIAYST